MKQIYILSQLIVFVFAFSAKLNAQYFTATHTSGTVTIAGNNVTVTGIGSGSHTTGFGCTSIGPYYFGINGPSLGKVAYLYEFSNKVKQVRIRVSGMNNGEEISFYVNGTQYAITSANIGAYYGSCALTTTMAVASSGGNLVMPPPTSTVGNGEVVIVPTLPMDSFRIYHIGAYQGGGVVYSFEFMNDSSIYVAKPYKDTLFCPGDTFYLKYFTTRTFNSGNTFTAQLSDATGSFSSPLAIGSKSGTGSNNDSIQCIIPLTATAGTGYRVRVAASNPTLLSGDNGVNIRIKALPAAVATSNTPICSGDTLKLYGNTGTGLIYTWTGPLSFSSATQNPTLPNAGVSASGDYILRVDMQGCISKDTVTVLVRPMPAIPTAGSNTPVCPGGTINLTSSSSTPGVSYTWAGPASYSSNTQNPSITGANAANGGTYSVTASLNGCTSAPATTVVQVFITTPTPTAGANTPVCAGTTLNLTANTINGATYSWTGPGSFTSNLQNPAIAGATSATAGIYSVTATLNGCTSLPGTVQVVVVNAPYVNIFPSPKDSICTGGTIRVVASAGNAGSSPQYQWYKNNVLIPGATGTSYTTGTVVDYDVFTCEMTSSGVCAASYKDTSNSLPIRVLPYLAPSVSITANPNTTVPSGTMINFKATPVNGGAKPTYQWTRNGTNIGGALSDVWGASTLSNGDDICVTMTSSYLCPNPTTAKSNCIKVSIETTGINSVWKEKIPDIYPNPTKDKLIIDGITKGVMIQLYDALGRVVITQTADHETVMINTAGLAPGNYVLLLSTDKGDRMRVKLVKE